MLTSENSTGVDRFGGNGKPGNPIEIELGRVLSSKAFRRSVRLKELLAFVVHSAVEGQDSTEMRIAWEVFNKAPDFSPSEDPIIRVQFGRLRKNLSRYYETEGAADPVMIEIPGRTYRPKFHFRDGGVRTTELVSAEDHACSHVTEAAGNARVDQKSPLEDEPGDQRTSMAVLPFANLTNDPKQDAFCNGLTEEITSSLAAIAAVKVVASSSAAHYRTEMADVRDVGKQLGVPLVLGGSVRMEHDHARVTAQLARAGDGVAVWADSFDSKVDGELNTQRLVARKVIESMPVGGDPSELTELDYELETHR